MRFLALFVLMAATMTAAMPATERSLAVRVSILRHGMMA